MLIDFDNNFRPFVRGILSELMNHSADESMHSLQQQKKVEELKATYVHIYKIFMCFLDTVLILIKRLD